MAKEPRKNGRPARHAAARRFHEPKSMDRGENAQPSRGRWPFLGLPQLGPGAAREWLRSGLAGTRAPDPSDPRGAG
jgi:hypothetical protein